MSERERKLAAIMFTDMVGFSALSQTNEPLSLSLLEEQRRIVRPILETHRGREVKTMGDGFLVEFGSALDAVTCAFALQKKIHEYDLSFDESRRIHLRIGVHLGDVIVSGGDVSGDAVNVASRIEPLAKEGGVCISRQVYDQVWNKVDFRFESLGLKTLKNIIKPVEVYRIVMPWEEDNKLNRKLAAEFDRNRIAVMPFANLSPDPNDSYFADGITEEIISTLSSISGLGVISRTSVMSYRGTTKNLRQVGEELQVGSVLEGSFRKAGNRIRVSTQLIDANNDRQVWSQRYDRELDDVFAIQSEIAEKVVDALKVRLISSERRKYPQNLAPTNLEAYNLYLKGRHLMTEGSDVSIRQALELFNEATKLDPNFARGYIGIGECYSVLGYRSYLSFDESINGIKSNARKALEIEDDLAEGHYLLALAAWFADERNLDEEEATKAVELNPNLPEAQSMLGIIKATYGYPVQSRKLLETAHSLNPLDSLILDYLGRLYIYFRMDDKFLELVNKNSNIAPLSVSVMKVEYFFTKGDLSSAEKELSWLEERYPNDFRVVSARGKLSALKGNRKSAESTIEELKENFGSGAVLVRHIAIIKYYLGDVDDFFILMEQAAREHVLDPSILRYSPMFENARKDPRYRKVMEASNLDPELKEPL
ncbi:MAG: adenylate/guanylate cyclase domain-containing protein [Nitrososphaerales archaeon]